MDEAAEEVDPEFGDVLAAGAEVADDAVDDIDALGGVAVLDFASEDGAGAGEDALGAFGEEGDAVVGIDEGEVEGEGIEQGCELIDGDVAGGQLDAAGGGGGGGGVRGRVAGLGLDEAPAVAGRGVEDDGPILFGEGAEGHGQQDVFLFVDHLFDRVFGDGAGGGAEEFPGAGAGFGLFEGEAEVLEEGAGVVVLGPHDLGGAGDAVGFEGGKEAVFLALIVLFDVHQLVVGLTPFEKLAGAVGGFGHGFDVFSGDSHAKKDAAEGFVFTAEGIDGMAGRDGARRGGDKEVAGDLGVEVAHGAKLFDGHSFGEEFLFHGDDFGVVGGADDLFELGFDLAGGFAGVEVFDDFLELADALGAIVDEFAHECLSFWFEYGGGERGGDRTLVTMEAL